jgi:drug/metabolite transporter superfamily protein YnfA
VVRLLNATAMLADADLLTGDDLAFEEFANALARELDQRPPDPEVGWNSVEGTADVTRGLVALIDHLHNADTQERLAAHIAGAATVLRRAMRRFDKRATSTAWLAQLARLVQALILVDERFPVGLQRLASLEWPAEGPVSAVTSIAEDSLMGDLAVQVKELRVKERTLQEQRLAAAIGRTVATLGGTLILAALFALLLWANTPNLTWWGWIGNVGVALSLLVIALGLYFTLLKRWYLLTAWGDRVRDLLTQVSDILGKVAKIKRTD